MNGPIYCPHCGNDINVVGSLIVTKKLLSPEERAEFLAKWEAHRNDPPVRIR